MRLRVLLMLVGVVALGCTGVGAPSSVTLPPDSAAGEVPFHLAGPGGAAIVVPAVLNGRDSVNLILDTGATLTCLDDSVARDLKLPERIGVIGARVTLGGTSRMRLVKLDSIRVGAATAKDFTVCTIDLTNVRMVGANVRGLLGLNFLRNFLVTLDFQRDVLRLERPTEGPASTRRSPAP
jgi:predicted aspartyl protease